MPSLFLYFCCLFNNNPFRPRIHCRSGRRRERFRLLAFRRCFRNEKAATVGGLDEWFRKKKNPRALLPPRVSLNKHFCSIFVAVFKRVLPRPVCHLTGHCHIKTDGRKAIDFHGEGNTRINSIYFRLCRTTGRMNENNTFNNTYNIVLIKQFRNIVLA